MANPMGNRSAIEAANWVEMTAQLLELPLEPEFRPGVIANWTRTVAIAQLVIDFPLPDNVEMAPTFQP